ncbi:MAG: TOBE domain-containing protein [Candidatus Competibacteraceae bacterium]
MIERTGATTLYVTHDQAEAMTLGDRGGRDESGRFAQQLAPPQELYEQPANVFVAGFIGNPPMNLFPAHVATDADGGLELCVGEQALPLAPTPVVERWQVWRDTPLTAGIRPEHLNLVANQSAGLRATVSDAEYLGHETLLHLHIDGMAAPSAVLVVRLPGIRPFHKGEAVHLDLDPTALHLFAPDGIALPDHPNDMLPST